ncbi:glycine receptor subunit alphaZ1-like [Stylophora pistillata]|uniref:glycine receptor subunit alphaZ1-like n=1 Tax=Stylophora pistillata TaxID=50429 RepID=UPI000C055153|nr:glycine receptor subunit alphaZ1-like [Stylophora pistillata]
MKKLFHEDRYDKRLRPFYRGPPVNVTIDMSLVHFGKVREIDMDFSVDIFFRQYWRDPRLNHSLEEPIFLTGSYRDLIWLPDTFFLNIKTAKFHNVPADNSRVKIRPDGQVTWSSRITMTANCQLDLRDYPLDRQSCNLTLLSYAYPIEQVDYSWKDKDKRGIVILEDQMNEFTLREIKTRRAIVLYGTRGSSKYAYPIEQVDYSWKDKDKRGIVILEDQMNEFTLREIKTRRAIVLYGTRGSNSDYTHLWAEFTFERRLGYAFIQIYAPTVLIVVLSWLSFWIAQDAVPARVALGVTTVLTIVTLMGSFRSSVPKVSYIKAVDVFFIISLFFVFGAVVEYVILRLYSEKKLKGHKKDDSMVMEMRRLKQVTYQLEISPEA